MINKHIENKAQLVTALAKGSEQAFRELFHAYRQGVYALAMRLTRTASLCDEVVQEVFLKLWLHRSTLETIQQFDAWLRVVTRNAAFDALKKKAKETAARGNWGPAIDTGHTDAEDRLLDKEYQKLFAEAIARLTPQQREIFRLSRIEGLKHKEIAARMNLSPLTVKKHIAQSLARIRDYLRHRDDHPMPPGIFFLFFL